MAEPLKRFFDRRRVGLIADQLAAAWPGFPRDRFVAEASAGLEGLGLVDRARHVAAAMARALPPAYPEALDVVLRSLGPALASPEGQGMEPFHYFPHAIFVAEHGLGHHALSMEAQRELTRRFSCEFSIRAFLEAEPERTLDQLRAWTRDPDEHVRRLVSEGTRPRLPWAMRLRRFQEDPAPVLALLEALKDDPSGYVRRSVANNLNDVSKDHPDLVLATCRRWLRGAPEERRRLVHHALRSLLRAGDPEAVRLAGGDHRGEFEVSGAVAPARVRIGGAVRCVVRVRNAGGAPARAVLALRVHFVKARGGTSAKVFRLPALDLAPGQAAERSRTVSVRQHTTRTHYPGEHRVEVLVNGQPRPLGRFALRPAGGPRGAGPAKRRR